MDSGGGQWLICDMTKLNVFVFATICLFPRLADGKNGNEESGHRLIQCTTGQSPRDTGETESIHLYETQFRVLCVKYSGGS